VEILQDLNHKALNIVLVTVSTTSRSSRKVSWYFATGNSAKTI